MPQTSERSNSNGSAQRPERVYAADQRWVSSNEQVPGAIPRRNGVVAASLMTSRHLNEEFSAVEKRIVVLPVLNHGEDGSDVAVEHP